MRKKIILPTFLALSVLVVGMLAVANVSAQELSDYPPVVQKIAERFNLNIDDVEKIFDEERDEKRADMYAEFAERLNDYVSKGKLTEVQKEAILDKHEEMQNQIETIDDLDFGERQGKIQAIHEEFRTWIKDQGIDLPLLGLFSDGFKHGLKESNMMGGKN